MFEGLWQGVSTTLGQGASQIAFLTGATSERQQYELEKAKIEAETKKAQYMFYAKVAGVVLIVGFILFLIVRKKS